MGSNFQQRHWAALAEALANARRATDCTDGVDVAVQEVAYTLMNDNPEFDAEVFYAAVREGGKS